MVHTVSASQWAKAAIVALVVAAWPAYTLFTESKVPAPDPNAELARLDYTLKDMDGKDVRLADFKGRPLVLNFWATYCPPCKHEIPSFVELVEKYKDQNLTILGISTDDSPEDLKKFAAEYKINYPVLVGLGHDEMLETYDASMLIPITWFIKKDGTVALKHAGTQTKDWFERQMKALF